MDRNHSSTSSMNMKNMPVHDYPSSSSSGRRGKKGKKHRPHKKHQKSKKSGSGGTFGIAFGIGPHLESIPKQASSGTRNGKLCVTVTTASTSSKIQQSAVRTERDPEKEFDFTNRCLDLGVTFKWYVSKLVGIDGKMLENVYIEMTHGGKTTKVCGGLTAPAQAKEKAFQEGLRRLDMLFGKSEELRRMDLKPLVSNSKDQKDMHTSRNVGMGMNAPFSVSVPPQQPVYPTLGGCPPPIKCQESQEMSSSNRRDLSHPLLEPPAPGSNIFWF